MTTKKRTEDEKLGDLLFWVAVFVVAALVIGMIVGSMRLQPQEEVQGATQEDA